MPGHAKARNRATISDVAAAAGVSRAAVSKVIRDAYGVSDAMRERVQAVIDELDYRPRISARGMRGATLTLGIEIPDFSNQFFDMVIAGASAALEQTSYQLIIAPVDSSRDESGAIHALADRQVDGVIVFSPLVGAAWLENLALDVPVVMLGRHDDSRYYDTVVGDDIVGARAVMEHLLGQGHQRIVHMTTDERATALGSGTPHAIRLQVYLEAMTDAGLARHIHVVRSDNRQAAAYAAATRLLDDYVPDAVFAGNDEPALGVLRALAERDLVGAVAVVGYDDTSAARHPLISLTSVDQSGAAMGRRAVEMLLERIGGRADPLHETFAPTLRVRASSGQVRPRSPQQHTTE